LANSGAALYVAGIGDSIEEGVEVAEKAVDEGEARTKLQELRERQ
ncbi:MAG: anthranilate phosphoribosyltransferase, partial [Halobacteria archaeon]|nr:anthranilate phosphoribosyltransferase [Halobacteria archaeon]